jgi:membrane-bound lytic murein transglycosylase MltF
VKLFWKGCAISILLAGIACALDAGAQARTSMTLASLKLRTSDFDGMLKRRVVRVLVPYSKTYFFIDRGDIRGIDGELGLEFQKWLNKRYKQKGAYRIHVAFIPTQRDQLLKRLNDGHGDIAAGGLTVTPERKAIVDFAAPWASDVKEVLVTGPTAPPVSSLADLGGREVRVRASSSYFTHLNAINRMLGDKPIKVVTIDENLEDEDLLEMVSAGLLPWAVVDRHKARLWAGIYPKLTVRDDIVIHDGGDMAWAIRAGNPKLKKVLGKFVATHKLGTEFGSDIFLRYVKDGRTVKNALAAGDLNKFKSFYGSFEKYGDAFKIQAALLAAQGYQESQLNQELRSRSGAVGIMQIKQSTASEKEIGVANVAASADANIHAAAKYLRFLAAHYIDDPAVDDQNKVLMALAAYNAGPGSLKRFRAYARQHGLNPNVWFGNVESAAAAIKGYETVQYVSNIYKYYIAYSALTAQELGAPLAATGKDTGGQANKSP